MKIDKNILEILNNGRVEGRKFYLPPGNLDRKVYLKVNEVLENLKGKWNKREKAHIFDYDVEEKIIEAINTGEIEDIINQKKLNQYFPTPTPIVKQMIEAAELKSSDIVLETSAGQGRISDEIFKITQNLAVCEIDKDNLNVLRKNKKYEKLFDSDFLSITFGFLFDKIIQNPPFHLPGKPQADLDFINHAWKFLKPNGIVVTICSPAFEFRNNKKSEEFRAFLQENDAEIIDLPEGTFKDSGTDIRTKLIKIKKS